MNQNKSDLHLKLTYVSEEGTVVTSSQDRPSMPNRSSDQFSLNRQGEISEMEMYASKNMGSAANSTYNSMVNGKGHTHNS